jgi:hypothetical protein
VPFDFGEVVSAGARRTSGTLLLSELGPWKPLDFGPNALFRCETPFGFGEVVSEGSRRISGTLLLINLGPWKPRISPELIDGEDPAGDLLLEDTEGIPDERPEGFGLPLALSGESFPRGLRRIPAFEEGATLLAGEEVPNRWRVPSAP